MNPRFPVESGESLSTAAVGATKIHHQPQQQQPIQVHNSRSMAMASAIRKKLHKLSVFGLKRELSFKLGDFQGSDENKKSVSMKITFRNKTRNDFTAQNPPLKNVYGKILC
jgi:hypothetical protein